MNNLYDNLPDNLKDLIDKGQFEEAFEQASSLAEKQAIASLYLDDEFGQVKGGDARDILIKLCVELDELETNPFIVFSKAYNALNKTLPSRAGYVALNNLYAKGIIDDHNLDGTDEDGTQEKSILFNNNLYNKSDIEFIIQSYYWLAQKSNLKRINYNALANDSTTPEQVRELAGKVMIQGTFAGNNVRNVIIYDISNEEAERDSSTYQYTVRDSQVIKNILHIAASRANVSPETQQARDTSNNVNVQNVLSSIAKLNDSEKASLVDALKGLL